MGQLVTADLRARLIALATVYRVQDKEGRGPFRPGFFGIGSRIAPSIRSRILNGSAMCGPTSGPESRADRHVAR